jgi:hypothetical protein
VIAAVSRSLIAEFAENLELTVLAAPRATTAQPVVGTETGEGANKAHAEPSPRT